jgi:hypothetical protein
MTDKEKTEAKIQTFDFLQKLNFIKKKIRLSEEGMFETVKPEPDPLKKSVEKIDFPKEGGIFTYFEGIDLPVKGYADGETVERVDEAKKMAMTMLWGLFRMSKIKFLLLLIFKRQIEELGESLIISFWEYIHKYRPKENRYCKTVREILLLFETTDYDVENKVLWHRIKDNICMVLEYDDAYRYRFQDIVEELNKEDFAKNPIKEMKRLFNIIAEREDSDVMRNKWKMISSYVFLLRLKPFFFKKLVEIVSLMELKEVKMDEADRYHAKLKVSYDFDRSK